MATRSHPLIRYDGSSPLCRNIAQALQNKLGAEQPEAVVLEPAEDLHRQARAGQARRQDQSNDDDGDDGDDEAAGIRTNS